MTRFTRITALAAALLSSASLPALAGGVGDPGPAPIVVPTAPTPAPSADWTGLYGGAQLAYGDVEVSTPAEGEGALLGIFGGYRQDLGNIVLGAELDLDGADIDLAGVGTLDAVARLGLEAGYDAGSALIYGTAGLARARVDGAGDFLVEDGVFYGVGVDYALSQSVTLGAEILHHEFEDFDGGGLDVEAMTIGVNAALRF